MVKITASVCFIIQIHTDPSMFSI